MARNTTFIRLFTLCVLALISGNARAQSSTINTAYTNAPGINALFAQPSYLTFQVNNTNAYAIAITELGNQHIAAATSAGPPVINYSQNGSKYALWYNKNSTATVPVDPATGWIFADSSATITTNANGIVQIMTGMKDVMVLPNSTYRFLLVCSDSISAVGNATTIPTPGSFTMDGVTLTTGGQPWGLFPNNSQTNGQAFNGNIVFERGLPKPEIKVTPAKAQYCVGESITLEAIVESYISNPTYTWRINGIIVGTGPSYPLPGSLAKGTVTVTCTITEGAYTSNEAVYTITFTEPPAPTVDGKFKYCLNEVFEPVIVNGQNPKWYYVAQGGSPIPVTPTINTSSPNSLIYYVSQTVNGCESSERTLVNLSAARQPAEPIVTTPIYYCEEVPADQLYAFGDNLKWYYHPTNTIHTEIAPTPNTSKLQELEYYVTQTVNGCESKRQKIDVIVTFKPNGLILTDKTEICAEEEVTLGYYGSADATAQYNWTMPEEGTTIVNGGYDQGPLVIKLSEPGKQQVKLRVGHVGCLSDEYVQDILVKPLPHANISARSDACLDQDILIESNNYTAGLDTFIWDFDGGYIKHEATGQGVHGVYWNTPGEKNISVTSIHDGCTATTTEMVTVHPKPDAKIVAEDYNEGDVICTSDSLKVSVGTVEPNAVYKWTPTRFFDQYSNEAVTYARIDFDSEIHVEVEDIYGCKNEGSLKVVTKSCCEMSVPNAFSPNADGLNDIFRPVTLGRNELKSFRVVNRYGQAVFETANASTGWDGKVNGKPAELGTYFYLISFKCGAETVNQSGEVILAR